MTPSRKRANDKYLKDHYEKICISYPKGTKEKWKSSADSAGVSLAEFVKTAVEYYILFLKSGGGPD